MLSAGEVPQPLSESGRAVPDARRRDQRAGGDPRLVPQEGQAARHQRLDVCQGGLARAGA